MGTGHFSLIRIIGLKPNVRLIIVVVVCIDFEAEGMSEVCGSSGTGWLAERV